MSTRLMKVSEQADNRSAATVAEKRTFW
jgi:hypothetical protein